VEFFTDDFTASGFHPETVIVFALDLETVDISSPKS
jgi:hypothetical protein